MITRDPAQATPKRAPFLVAEVDHADRPIGLESLFPQPVEAASALTTPSGPSNAPPSGTLSRWEPVTTPGRSSGSPHHAHWLPIRSSVSARPRRRGRSAEPLPQQMIFLGQRVPAVATCGARRPTSTIADQRASNPVMPTRSPRRLLHRDPDAPLGGDLLGPVVPGVDVTDDAHRRVVGEHPGELVGGEFGAVGDRHLTGVDRPPDPTPPPWWIETQVAPDAVLIMALSSGQSAMASEPSSIRLGLPIWAGDRAAVEMITTDDDRRGISPLATRSLKASPAWSRSP